jgi:hypothetical protein
LNRNNRILLTSVGINHFFRLLEEDVLDAVLDGVTGVVEAVDFVALRAPRFFVDGSAPSVAGAGVGSTATDDSAAVGLVLAAARLDRVLAGAFVLVAFFTGTSEEDVTVSTGALLELGNYSK